MAQAWQGGIADSRNNPLHTMQSSTFASRDQGKHSLFGYKLSLAGVQK
jgi:hypothetical protein